MGNVAKRTAALLLAAAAYTGIGVVTAALSGAAATSQGRTGWRLTAWLLSFAVFGAHTWYARFALRDARLRVAVQTSLGVALGALSLAALGPVRSHWSSDNLSRTAALSLILWPVITGIPAFGGSLVLLSVLDRLAGRDTVAISPPVA
jgi:hypothetical protein